MMLMPMVAGAETVEIDGINYNLILKVKEAEVAKNYWSLDSIVIPASVTYDGIEYRVTCIGKYAFNSCVNLTSVTIPTSVTKIEDGAFESSGLTSVTIPNSVTSIGVGTFCGCQRLTSITIPNSVTRIGEGAFQDCCSMITVTIPGSVTTRRSRKPCKPCNTSRVSKK